MRSKTDRALHKGRRCCYLNNIRIASRSLWRSRGRSFVVITAGRISPGMCPNLLSLAIPRAGVGANLHDTALALAFVDNGPPPFGDPAVVFLTLWMP